MNLLIKKVNAIKLKSEYEGRFSLFHANFINDRICNAKTYKAAKYMYDTVLEHDKKCKLPYEIGVSLENLIKSNEYVVGVHRTNLNLNKNVSGFNSSKELNSVMKNGLINYGHINAIGGSAFTKGAPSLTLTITPLVGLAGYINLISSYKENDSVILFAFPKIQIDKNGNIRRGLVDDSLEVIDKTKLDTIYKLEDKKYIINPEFILGAILKKNNGLDEFFTREEILNNKEKNK